MGPLRGLLGLPGGFVGPWARNVVSCSPPGAPLEAFLGPSWAVLEASWAVLEPSWALSGASRALLGRCWGPLGPSWGVGKPKRWKRQNLSKTYGKAMNFASWGPLGSALGGLLGRLGAILGVLERSCGISEPSCTILGAPWEPLGPSWGSRGRLGALLVRSWSALGESPGGRSGVARGSLGGQSGYFSSGDPQGPPRARELEILFTCYRRS